MPNGIFSALEKILKKRRGLNQDFEENLQRKVSSEEVSILTKKVPLNFAVHKNLDRENYKRNAKRLTSLHSTSSKTQQK